MTPRTRAPAKWSADHGLDVELADAEAALPHLAARGKLTDEKVFEHLVEVADTAGA